ncbi:hypothetical protein BDF14DRAFT_1733977 [Spinellus fusiger]|nr:hypothetical protein BDF14DRAFT_1733977 [Spinellus fusiger]
MSSCKVKKKTRPRLHYKNASGYVSKENENSDPGAVDLESGLKSYSHTVMTDESLFEKKKQIMLLLGQTLLKSGCPCHAVEDILKHTSKVFNVNATFSFLPDSVIFTFTHAVSEVTESIMVKAPIGFDTHKIGQINKIMNSYHNDKTSIQECLTELQNIAAAPATCGVISTLIAFGASSFSASCVLFGGSWADATLSGALGLLVALLSIVSSRFHTYSRVFDVSASVVVAIIVRAMHNYVCFTKVAVSAVLILLPGYGMTMAVVSKKRKRKRGCCFYSIVAFNASEVY